MSVRYLAGRLISRLLTQPDGYSQRRLFVMVVEYTKFLPYAFVIDDMKLKKLTELLEDSLGSVNFSVKCAGGRSYNFESVEDLINYENPKSKKILKLYLFVHSADDRRSSLISFDSDSGIIPGIYMKLEVEENELLTLEDKIEDVIAGMRPWYNIMSRLSIWIIIGVTFLIAIASLIILKLSGIMENVDADTRYSVSRVIVFGTAALIGYPVYKMLSTCFPRGVFAIGQGKSRFSNLKKFHGVMVSIIIGLIFFVASFLIN